MFEIRSIGSRRRSQIEIMVATHMECDSADIPVIWRDAWTVTEIFGGKDDGGFI